MSVSPPTLNAKSVGSCPPAEIFESKTMDDMTSPSKTIRLVIENSRDKQTSLLT